MATDQFGYLWRNDDGTETTATDAALEDVSVSSAVGTSLRLRIGVDATTDPASAVPTLQVRTPTGPWQDVPLETSTGPALGDGLLLELTDFLLLEIADFLLLETNSLQLEDVTDLLLEDGTELLLE